MSAQGNGERQAYHVSVSGAVATQIKTEGRRARQANQLTAFIAALRVVEQRLRTDPLGFGELTGDAPGGDLVYHTGTVSPISVRFAIDQENSVVYIREVILNST